MKLPKFANESEEAKWWFDNQDLLEAEFAKAASEGRLGHGAVARLAQKLEKAKTTSDAQVSIDSVHVG